MTTTYMLVLSSPRVATIPFARLIPARSRISSSVASPKDRQHLLALDVLEGALVEVDRDDRLADRDQPSMTCAPVCRSRRRCSGC
ncbi:MAG: hypothetical protein R3A79_21110 [Nannocystaceae bacterium]